MSYAKLFSSIVHSTVWELPDHVRIVWITLLALKDAEGIVRASVPGLSRAAAVSREKCEEALSVLSSPDTESANKDHEGRRILPIEGGWFVVSHDKYRKLLSIEERRERDAARKRAQRASARVRIVTNVAESLPSEQSISNHLSMDGSPPAEPAKAKRPRRGTLSHFVPATWNPRESHRQKVSEWTDSRYEVQVSKFRNWEFKTARSDWDRAFHNWLDEAVERSVAKNDGRRPRVEEDDAGYA